MQLPVMRLQALHRRRHPGARHRQPLPRRRRRRRPLQRPPAAARRRGQEHQQDAVVGGDAGSEQLKARRTGLVAAAANSLGAVVRCG